MKKIPAYQKYRDKKRKEGWSYLTIFNTIEIITKVKNYYRAIKPHQDPP
jgi:hypothetical protein